MISLPAARSVARHDAKVPDSRGGEPRLSQIPRPIQGDPERVLLWTQVITGTELDEHGQIRVLDADTWQQRRQQLEKLGGPPEP